MKALPPLTEVSFQWISSADTTVCEMLIEEEGRSIPWRGLSVCGPSCTCGNNQLAVVLWASARNGGMGALAHVCVSWAWHWAACGWLIVSNCCQGCPLLGREQVLESLLWLECMRKWSLEDLQLLIIWNLKGIYKSQEDEVIGKKNKSCHSWD